MSVDAAMAEPATIKGWCPGALRPMQTGDGLIVRVRPRCGALSISQALALSEIARRFGNGHIDLTRRANLQIRGVQADALPGLWAELSDCGLVDDNAEAEAVRNVMVAPLAGGDPSEICDVRPVAATLEQELLTSEALWALPGKFGFSVDGGGIASLDDERADVRLKALRAPGGVWIAVGIDTISGVAWLGAVEPQSAHVVAVAVAMEFLAVSEGARRGRMRDLAPGDVDRIRRVVASHGADPFHAEAPVASPSAPYLAADLAGLMVIRGAVVAAGIGAPFGRLEASALGDLAVASRDLGLAELRLSPWRMMFAPVPNRRCGEAILEAAAACGLITTPRHPLMSIDACPGAPACRSGLIETRAIAARLAGMMPLAGISSVHVSGCAKGCSRSASADLVLVGTPTGVGIIRSGTAASNPCAVVPPGDLARLPSLLQSGS